METYFDGWISRTTHVTKWWTPYKWEPPVIEVDETEEFVFESITLAYEVDLKLVSHDHVVKRYILQPAEELHNWYARCCGGTSITLEEWTEHFKLSHLILDYESGYL